MVQMVICLEWVYMIKRGFRMVGRSGVRSGSQKDCNDLDTGGKHRAKLGDEAELPLVRGEKNRLS